MVRVLLAEDHAVVREGTRQILDADPAIEVIGEAADGAEVVAMAARLRPDVVLLDLHMPVINGIEATRRMIADAPDARILVLSAYDEEDYVEAALDAGARGYLLKSAHGHEVVAAIRAVAEGQVVMDARLARRALRRRDDPAADVPTARELEVLRLAARGLRTRDIAAELGTSPRTIEAHFTSIFNRFGVTTRTEAVMHAAARRWIRHEGDRGSVSRSARLSTRPKTPSAPTVRRRRRFGLPPVRERAFWAVQVLTLVIAAAHTLLLQIGFPEALDLIPSSLFYIPVVYAALTFGVGGAIPTAVWSTVLLVPDLLLAHDGSARIGVLWQSLILVAIGAFVGMAVDNERAARREAESREAARLASERRYRALYDRAADAVLVIDREARIEEANAAAARLLDRDLGALRGRSLVEVVGPDLAADVLSGAMGGPRRLPSSEPTSPVWVQAVGASPLTGATDDGSSQVLLRDVTLQYEREQGLEGYARHATAAREEERRRMAYELHDGPLQSLVLLLRKLDSLDDVADDDGVLEDARQIIDETAAELRRLSRALRPPILDDLGLMAAVRSEASAFSRRSGIDARFEVAGPVRPLPKETELLLLRVAQESLHNAERHSAATSVEVRLTYDARWAELVVSDDGVGMESVPTPTGLLARGKLGLLGMQERVRLAQGSLDIDARPGGGTTVSVRVPVAAS